ncbi:MAG: HlyD family type I secretion periplasmic adaptor subunit [Methylococcales bacterium]|jgi:epimerase transport system membrane fusion protein|nr:HlyD family type I secretion periplasmic adaptor subunit [Methylococcales bacterium]
MKERLVQLTTENGTPIITDDRSVRTIGIIILVVTFGILGTWGYLAPIDSAALAPGYVAVKSHRKTVQHLDGGIVSQLLAKDGDVVKAGDVLLILDGTEVKAQLEILRGQHITLAAQLARLIAERDQLNQIKFPDDLQDLSDAHIAEARQGESQIFTSRKSAYQGEISVLNQRASQLSAKIKGLEGQRTSKQELMKSYGDEVHDLKELLAEGFANKQRLRDIERNYANATSDVAALSAEIAGNEIQIGETKLQILQIQKKFQEEVAAKLGEVQAELYDVAQRLLATTDKVIRTEIKAPANGRVLGLSVHNVGGVITPGKPILDIVPQKEELIIDAQVSPMDIDRVIVGLLAEVRFSAFKQALTPKMQGKVINLSADRLTDEKTGMPYYQAQVELTPDSFEKLGDMELVPGMPAEVLINTGERTVFEYLMQPITNAFARAFIED